MDYLSIFCFLFRRRRTGRLIDVFFFPRLHESQTGMAVSGTVGNGNERSRGVIKLTYECTLIMGLVAIFYLRDDLWEWQNTSDLD